MGNAGSGGLGGTVKEVLIEVTMATIWGRVGRGDGDPVGEKSAFLELSRSVAVGFTTEIARKVYKKLREKKEVGVGGRGIKNRRSHRGRARRRK